MFGRILIGLIIVGTGYLFTWKTDIPMDLFGYSEWGGKYFGGGSRSFYKLMGIVMILIGAMVMTNLHEAVLNAIFGSFVR